MMATPKSRLTPRKTPRQRRSEATCVAILQAAARILETGGVHGLTTNHVAALAGVSVGTLYQYFPAKEAILAELIRGMRQEMLADFESAAREARGKGLACAADVLVAASLRHHLRRPALAQALEREEHELKLSDETRALKAGLRDLVVGVLREGGVKEPERTAFDLMALSHGMAGAAVQAGERDFDDLHARMCRAVTGYLGI
jgi:AcrR family transcriptional regulator